MKNVDSDMLWFFHQVVNQPFIKSELDYDLKHPTMDIWIIPTAPYKNGFRAGSIILARSDYREQDSGKDLFPLEEAIDISDRLTERFGLGLITVKQWVGIYSYVARLIGCDSKKIADALNLRFLSKEDAYWTDGYFLTIQAVRLVAILSC